MNKSASGFTICEDFERLKRLKCEAPKQIQAQRELNPSVANWKSAGAFIVQFVKICDIHFFYRMNKSASGFTICEDFERLKRLKCEAPKQIQAQRELNPSVANWKSAGAFIVQFIKICDIHFFIILAQNAIIT